MAQGSNRPECDAKARRAFQFFYEVCQASFSRYEKNSAVWTRMVLQASHCEESIKHLVIAASCLGLCRRRGGPTSASEDFTSFLFHHGRALALLSRGQWQKKPSVILLACLLLVLCGQLQDRDDLAAQHAQAGKKILASHYIDGGLHSHAHMIDPAIDEIAVVFSKLNIDRKDGSSLHMAMPGMLGLPGPPTELPTTTQQLIWSF